MKKAVIATGSKQYIVTEGETLEVELLKSGKKTIVLEPLLVIDDNGKVAIGRPILSDSKVTVEIIDPDKQAEKVTAIRYKAKKRVHKVRGHRQHHSILKVKTIN